MTTIASHQPLMHACTRTHLGQEGGRARARQDRRGAGSGDVRGCRPACGQGRPDRACVAVTMATPGSSRGCVWVCVLTARVATPWLHGRLSREEVGAVFEDSGMKEGLYLVRESINQPGDYVLSVFNAPRIQHFAISVCLGFCGIAVVATCSKTTTKQNFTEQWRRILDRQRAQVQDARGRRAVLHHP